MYKRFISIMLALVLSFSFAVTAGASTVLETVSPSDAYDDGAEGGEVIQPSDSSDSSLEIKANGDQPEIDENGHVEIEIEFPMPSIGQDEVGTGEPVSGEENSPATVRPEEPLEPKGRPASAYPITDYIVLWVSGTILDKDNNESIKKYILPDQNDQLVDHNTTHDIPVRYSNTEKITIAIYQGGYGNREITLSHPYTNAYNLTNNPVKALTLDEYGGATTFQYEYVLYDLDPAIMDLTITFCARTYDRSNEWKRTLNFNFAGDRGPEPKGIEFSFDSNNPEQYTLENIDESMEYRIGYNGNWKPCTGDKMIFSTRYEGYDFLVRYKGKDGGLESKFAVVTMPERREAPTASINWFDESFKNLTIDMEYSIGDGEYNDVTEEMIAGGITPFLDNVTETGYVPLNIRYKLTDSQPVSEVKTIKLYPRADKPDKTKLSVDPNTYILTGVTSSMQYKGPEDTAWKAISGTSVNLSNYAKSDATVTIWVRTKSSTGKSYSTPVPMELPPAAPSPELDIDYYNEKITGFQSGVTYQYKLGTGTWKSFTPKNNEFSIASLITSKEQKISIRSAGTADSQMSGTWEESLPARIAAPACAFVYNDPANVGSAVLTGLEAGMEYQLKGETSWTPYFGQNIVIPLPSANKTYYVRVAATDSSFASTNKTLTLYAPGTAPTSSLNITTENITISKTAEYRIDNGAYTTLPSGITTLSATEYIDQLSGAETRTITVRFAATETKPASKEKTIKLVARREGPTTMQFDAATQKITGATTSMQYRVKGTTAWKTVTSKTFSVASLINGQTNVVLEFRYKPVNSLVGSKITERNCF